MSAVRHLGVWPDAGGHFGPYGGRFVPETLMEPLRELDAAYAEARRDPAFRGELAALLRDYVGRPTPLGLAARLSDRLGCRVYLKREDLCHTGAHKINNALGQGLLVKRMGKPRVVAETGAGLLPDAGGGADAAQRRGGPRRAAARRRRRLERRRVRPGPERRRQGARLHRRGENACAPIARGTSAPTAAAGSPRP